MYVKSLEEKANARGGRNKKTKHGHIVSYCKVTRTAVIRLIGYIREIRVGVS